MIKVETLGMLDIAKINPVLKSEKEVKNYSFIVNDGVTYLVCNTIVGDDAYKDNVVISAGEFLNGYDVSAWVNQKLVVDGKHVTGGVSALEKGAVLVVDEATGMLAPGSAAGVHFVVTDTNVTLTEAAVKVRVAVA